MTQLTAAMEGRWTTLQIGSNSHNETDLFRSLSKALQLWLQQIMTTHNKGSNSNSNLSQSRNSSNEQNQDKDRNRNQSHRHETKTTSAQ
jgi:hypothetical protein